MATITVKQFFRNVFYIMLTLSATPYMLLSTFLSLFMEVPVLSLSMEVYLPGYDLTPKYEEEESELRYDDLRQDPAVQSYPVDLRLPNRSQEDPAPGRSPRAAPQKDSTCPGCKGGRAIHDWAHR
jgi:hypothetical protein